MAPIYPIDIYRHLNLHFGDSNWWPAETPFEMMVGAILTQQTIWNNVQISIGNLRTKGLLSVTALARTNVRTVERCVRPSGFFRQKARRIKNLAAYLETNYHGDLKIFFNRDTMEIRKELLKLEGVGPETADSMLLFAGKKPKFVIDAYTLRIFKRLGCDLGSNYAEAQDFFESRVLPDTRVYANYHAYLVELGKEHCRIKPMCKGCPLASSCAYYKKASRLS